MFRDDYRRGYAAELERLDARRCRTGYGCGNSCIPLSKECRKEPKAASGRERVNRIRELAAGGAEGRGLGRLRQSEAGAKLQELEGQRSQRAQELQQQRQGRGAKAESARVPDRDRDRAQANIPMKGRRGRDLDREITRNVRQQKAEARAADRERNRTFKQQQSQAKQLREKYEKEAVAHFAQKLGKTVPEMRAVVRGMEPAKQIQFFEQWEKERESRGQAEPSIGKVKGGMTDQQRAELEQMGQGVQRPGGRAAAGRDLEGRLRNTLGDLAASDRDLFNNLGQHMNGIARHLNNLAELEGTQLEWTQSQGKQLPAEPRQPRQRRPVARNAREAGLEAEKALREGGAGLAASDRDLFQAGAKFVNAGRQFVQNYEQLNQEEQNLVLGQEEAAPQRRIKGTAAKAEPAVSAPKASEAQRTRREYLNQQGGKIARGLREASQSFRTVLPKRDQERLGAKTVGGALLKLYEKHSMNRKQGLGTADLTLLQKMQEISGNSFRGLGEDQFQGVKLMKDNTGRWQLYIDGTAKKQMRLAEKAASRPGATKRRKPKAAAEPEMSDEMKQQVAYVLQHKEYLKNVNKQIRQLREKIKNATASDPVGNMRLEMIKLRDRANEHQMAIKRGMPKRVDSDYLNGFEDELMRLDVGNPDQELSQLVREAIAEFISPVAVLSINKENGTVSGQFRSGMQTFTYKINANGVAYKPAGSAGVTKKDSVYLVAYAEERARLDARR